MTLLLVDRLPFPFEASAPMVACVAGDRLHVVAADLVAAEVRHISVGRDGFAGPGVALPLAYPTGLAACDGALIVAGASSTDGSRLPFASVSTARRLCRSTCRSPGRCSWADARVPARRPGGDVGDL